MSAFPGGGPWQVAVLFRAGLCLLRRRVRCGGTSLSAPKERARLRGGGTVAAALRGTRRSAPLRDEVASMREGLRHPIRWNPQSCRTVEHGRYPIRIAHAVPLVMCAVTFACSCDRGATAPASATPTHTARTMAAETLEQALLRLSDWPPPGGSIDWSSYLAAARLLAAADPLYAREKIEGFVDGAPGGLERTMRGTRVFLLFRVAFDLPTNAPHGERRIFLSLTNWPHPDAQGTVDLSWPVAWNNGRPILLAPCTGGSGAPYSAGDEFAYLFGTYSYRPDFTRRD